MLDSRTRKNWNSTLPNIQNWENSSAIFVGTPSKIVTLWCCIIDRIRAKNRSNARFVIVDSLWPPTCRNTLILTRTLVPMRKYLKFKLTFRQNNLRIFLFSVAKFVVSSARLHALWNSTLSVSTKPRWKSSAQIATRASSIRATWKCISSITLARRTLLWVID